MAAESQAFPFERVMGLSGARQGAIGTTPLGPAVLPPRRRKTFVAAIAILGGSILVALAVPIMVIAVPVLLLARMVLSVVWARTRRDVTS